MTTENSELMASKKADTHEIENLQKSLNYEKSQVEVSEMKLEFKETLLIDLKNALLSSGLPALGGSQEPEDGHFLNSITSPRSEVSETYFKLSDSMLLTKIQNLITQNASLLKNLNEIKQTNFQFIQTNCSLKEELEIVKTQHQKEIQNLKNETQSLENKLLTDNLDNIQNIEKDYENRIKIVHKSGAEKVEKLEKSLKSCQDELQIVISQNADLVAASKKLKSENENFADLIKMQETEYQDHLKNSAEKDRKLDEMSQKLEVSSRKYENLLKNLQQEMKIVEEEKGALIRDLEVKLKDGEKLVSESEKREENYKRVVEVLKSKLKKFSVVCENEKSLRVGF